ncbi:hypothetical protein J1614_003748 [Plenodomus biglobosus]|nr:hypothetical protein J1614_003748 [Plenodomus biglobosus]
MKFWALTFTASSLIGQTSAWSTCNKRHAVAGTESNAYDFIVVGGGTAGLAVASRISAGLPYLSVLVIEAGPDGRQDPGITVPGRKGSTLGGKYDWNFTTVAQPAADNRVFAQNRGKVLGGSSALNLMTWDRTSVAELDAWETKLGNKGWNWKSLYAAMLKVETFQPSPLYGKQGVGKTGPIGTLINRIIPKHQSAWIPTLQNLGVPENKESLNGNPLGVSTQPSNVNPDYTRSYAPEYLKKIAKPNLTLKLETRVAKVNFRGTAATGVTLSDGTVIHACREVILSAGTFQTPGILEHSGIGNHTLLQQLSIPLVKPLSSVGENLQDHIRIQSTYQLKPSFPSFDQLRNTTHAALEQALYTANLPSLYDYTASGYAYLTWPQVSNTTASQLRALAFTPSPNTPAHQRPSRIDLLKASYHLPPRNNNRGPKIPNLEIIFSDGYTGRKGYPAPSTPLFGISTFALIGVLQHPLSKGSIHISSSNIAQPPVINPNYLAHPHDLQAATHLARFLRTIAHTQPLRGVWSTEYEPGEKVQRDEDWEAWAKANVLSIYHPVGSCAMLPEEAGGVVDTQLKVWGTSRLRIVDASVVPVLPSAHLQTLVYGIAERAAEMVIKEHGGWR